jgi:hypothetical protein
MYSIHNDVHKDVEIVIISMCPPAAPGEKPKRKLIISGVALTDSQEASEEASKLYLTNPILDKAEASKFAKTSSLAEQREDQIRANPEGWRYFVDNIWVDGETEEIIQRIKPLFVDLPEPEGFTIWFSMGPVRKLPDMALSMQSPAYVATYLLSEDITHDSRNRKWLDDAMEYAQPVTKGTYLGDSDFSNRQLKFMEDENFARLQQIIQERDPENLFVRYLAKDPSTLNKNHWEL